MKVFDWNKAATLILENNIKNASAGLAEDWYWTSGDIMKDGEVVPKEETYCFLASKWATPVLSTGNQTYECYLEVSDITPDAGPLVYWPQSALDILYPKRTLN